MAAKGYKFEYMLLNRLQIVLEQVTEWGGTPQENA